MTAIDTHRQPSREPEMVPRFLVIAMFSLMGLSLSLVGFAQLSGAPHTGVLLEAPVVAERTIEMVGTRKGDVTVYDTDGNIIARSGDDKMGFIGVVWRVLARHRLNLGLPDTGAVEILRRENGNVAIHDTATDWSIDLIGYGKDNVAAFARLVD